MTAGGDGLGRKVARSAIWVLLEQWSTKVVSLVLFAIMARLLSPAEIGLVALATVFTAILQVFVNSGFSKALIQKPVLGPLDATTAFWTSMAISVVMYAALVAGAPLLAGWLGEPQLTPILIVLGAVIPLSALSRTPAALLARDFGFKTLSLRQVSASVAGAVIAIPLAFAGAGAWALVAQALAEALIAVVVLWTSTAWRPAFAFSLDALRSLWRTGVSLLGIELLDVVQSQIDKLLVGALFSTSDLGIYSLAQRLGVMLQDLISSVISRISLTTFSRAQEDPAQVTRIFRQLTFVSAAISFPIFALVAVLAPQIIPFLFGPGWDAAVPLIWIMVAGWAFAAVAVFDRGALVGTGHAGAALGLAVAQNLISIGLVAAFAPLGVVGIAISRFARIVTWPIRLVVLQRLIGLRAGAYVAQVLKCVLAVAPAVVAIALLQTTPWAAVDQAFWLFAVPLGIAGFALSAALMWLLAGTENRAALRRQVAQFGRAGRGRGTAVALDPDIEKEGRGA
jgi:teichuronic acid exporter